MIHNINEIYSLNWMDFVFLGGIILKRKMLLIELIVYIVLVVVGIILLFVYEPREYEIVIPQDFQIERGESDVTIPNE